MFLRLGGNMVFSSVCLQPSHTKSFSALKGTVYAKLDTSVLCRGGGGRRGGEGASDVKSFPLSEIVLTLVTIWNKKNSI